jgi:hypothetical protein
MARDYRPPAYPASRAARSTALAGFVLPTAVGLTERVPLDRRRADGLRPPARPTT